ncbi:MAG TPA: TetR family transcriptional regulator [Actinocrinis sp.]|nr:TetR family transcriptional regulator [Actinocrinis sp.]
MPRPKSPLLSRAAIIAAALDQIDAEGLAALSTRTLARRLGVSGPSLYNHFHTKHDLLEAVADSLIGQVDISGLDRGPWPRALAEWARSYHAVLIAHPNLVPIAGAGPGRRPSALRMADTVYGALVAAGWPPREATRIGALMRFFVIGSALGSFAAGFLPDPSVYADDYPHLREAHLLADRRQAVDEGAFELGLTALIAGLGQQFAALPGTGSPPPDG